VPSIAARELLPSPAENLPKTASTPHPLGNLRPTRSMAHRRVRGARTIEIVLPAQPMLLAVLPILSSEGDSGDLRKGNANGSSKAQNTTI